MKRRLVAVVAVLGLWSVLIASPAYAWSPFGSIDCTGDAQSSAVCTDKSKTDNPLTGNNGLILKITRIIALLAGAAAVIMIVIGGFKLVLANGDSNSVSSARNTITYALVGLVVIVLAQSIITYVVSRI